jgi:hypothetical protein
MTDRFEIGDEVTIPDMDLPMNSISIWGINRWELGRMRCFVTKKSSTKNATGENMWHVRWPNGKTGCFPEAELKKN